MKKLKNLMENFKQSNLKRSYERAEISEACPNITRIENIKKLSGTVINSYMDMATPMIQTGCNYCDLPEEIMTKEYLKRAELEKQWEEEKAQGKKYTYSRNNKKKIIRTEVEIDKK